LGIDERQKAFGCDTIVVREVVKSPFLIVRQTERKGSRSEGNDEWHQARTRLAAGNQGSWYVESGFTCTGSEAI
jgi:hypothetical protein